MRKLIAIGKVLMVGAGLLVLTSKANLSCTDLTTIANRNHQADSSDQEGRENTYIQLFDVVSQNVQLQYDHVFLHTGRVIAIKPESKIAFGNIYRLSSLTFFKVLFQKIISPNAP